jgi:hypothetical protein
MAQFRDVWLWNAEKRGHCGLGEFARGDQVIESHRQLGAQFAFACVIEAEVDEDVTATRLDTFSHSVPRVAARQLQALMYQVNIDSRGANAIGRLFLKTVQSVNRL